MAGARISVCVLVLLMSSGGARKLDDEPTVFGQLKSGFQLAGKLLGIDHANGVAQLVTEAFGNSGGKDRKGDAENNIFAGFLRILGFDSKKVGAITVNALIFVAQLISSSLTRPSDGVSKARLKSNDSPFEWMLKSKDVVNIWSHIQDENLPDHLISYIKEKSLDEDTDCVQLLICKSSPFVWGMQKALANRNRSEAKGEKSFYEFLPTVENVTMHGEECDKKHPFCFIDV